MRTLAPAPESAVDTTARAPRFGSYEGSIYGVDLRALCASRVEWVATHKHWLFASVVTERLFVAAAVVRLGYSATAFAYAYDAQQKRFVAHESRLGPAPFARVRDEADRGVRATFRGPGARFELSRGRAGHGALSVQLGALALDARLDASEAPPAITAVASVPRGIVDVTEKRALLRASGTLRVGGARYDLAGGHGGYDLTQGLLARHTAWRWAFAMGHTREGVPFGFNLVQGFVGEPECALWLGDALVPLGEGRIELRAGALDEPWSVASACGALALRFEPGAAHREDRALVVVSSRFAQAVGAYTGTITAPDGRTLHVDGALGVAEEQDTRW